MPLKTKATRLHDSAFFSAVSYRIPLPVSDILLFPDKNSYPICPRCDSTLDREYMHFCDRCGQRLAWNFFHFATVIYAPRR